MDLMEKLGVLADAAKYDASCASSGGARRDSTNGRGVGSTTGTGICHSYTPDGRCVSLLKILLTNFCIYDCVYCVNRRSSGVQRARFSVAEVVQLTIDFYQRNYIEGLFLSSGIIRNADYTMEQLVEVARRLRENEDFRGYIHLKTIPDASPELIAAAGRHADRLSINVELPTEASLQKYAPEKSVLDIRKTMARTREGIDEARAERKVSKKAPRFAPAGQSTQLIVGADSSDDATILTNTQRLYSTYKLRRVYYSAYSPIPERSSLLPARAPPLIREHRLYQADWLMRFYGFDASEITEPTSPQGQGPRNLALDIDPKLAWALRHREQFPVDLNCAPRSMLLRVPGLGTRSVSKLISLRREQRIRFDDLTRMRLPLKKLSPFIRTLDYGPPSVLLDRLDLRNDFAGHTQLPLF